MCQLLCDGETWAEPSQSQDMMMKEAALYLLLKYGLFDQQQRPLTHQPLYHLPPSLTADYFVNTVKQPPCLYVAYWLHNNNIPLLCAYQKFITPHPGVRKPMKTLQKQVILSTLSCHRSITTYRPNNIPLPINIVRVYNVTNWIDFLDGNIFK